MTEERRKHHFRTVAWDGLECAYCLTEGYSTQTTYCDEVKAERVDKKQREQDRIDAIEVARKALTADQWTLLGLDRVAKHRD